MLMETSCYKTLSLSQVRCRSCDPSTWEVEQEGLDFKASLGYIVS